MKAQDEGNTAMQIDTTPYTLDYHRTDSRLLQQEQVIGSEFALRRADTIAARANTLANVNAYFGEGHEQYGRLAFIAENARWRECGEPLRGLREILQYVSEVSEGQVAKDADDSDMVGITVTVGWLREVEEALASADGNAAHWERRTL